jgi:hypothetical protein
MRLEIPAKPLTLPLKGRESKLLPLQGGGWEGDGLIHWTTKKCNPDAISHLHKLVLRRELQRPRSSRHNMSLIHAFVNLLVEGIEQIQF